MNVVSLPPATPCRAPMLFAQMRAAEGGAAADGIGETIASGTVNVSGLNGPGTIATDRRDGRWSRNFRVRYLGPTADAYDGKQLWARDISGGVHAIDAPFSRRRTVTDAYLERRAYFGPSAATFTCLGETTEDGQRVERIRTQPRGGTPAILAIDPRTHLLASISERLPTTTEVTRFSDYRAVEGLVLPFSIRSGTLAEPENGYAFAVRRYIVVAHPRNGDFGKPAELNAARMIGSARSTTVPVVLDGRQLLVWASIDGNATMPFILDTGGHAILTTQAARALHLNPHGAGVSGGSGAGTISLQYAGVETIRIGNALVPHQTFLVIPYPYSFYERGRHQPIAGILGLEIFERFVTQIDYGRGRLTLTPFATYTHGSHGGAIPISFQEDMPLADAGVDGKNGLFGVDTGNAGTVILFGSYLDRTNLARTYATGMSAQGHGTGGSNSGRIVTLHAFSVAHHTFAKVPAFLTYMRSGSFSSWTEAGNFGYEILSRFVPTFDYARRTLYLDSSPFAHAPPKNRAGFAAGKDRPGVFVVERVKPSSPAASAGLATGDQITKINGKPAADFSYGDLYTLVTGAAKSTLRLSVTRGGKTRDVTLVLQ